MFVTLNNPKTGEYKSIRIGWSWTCFLFSGLFGVPLFARRLYGLGAAMAALSLFTYSGVPYILVHADYAVDGMGAATGLSADDATRLFNIALGVLVFLLALFFGWHGNKLTFVRLLKLGWVPVDLQSEGLASAQRKWILSENVGGEP